MALQKLNLNTQGASNTAPPGGIIQTLVAMETAKIQLVNNQPSNDTIPTTSLMNAIPNLNITITPSKAGNILLVELVLNNGGYDSAGSGRIVSIGAIFKNSETNASAVGFSGSYFASGYCGAQTILMWSMTAPDTTPITFKPYFGGSGSGALNGWTTSRVYGGVATSASKVSEIAV